MIYDKVNNGSLTQSDIHTLDDVFKNNNEIQEVKNAIFNYTPTIITMLYDIASMENGTTEKNRTLETYIDLSKQFLLKLPYPIIFFIDDNKNTYDLIYNVRKELNLLENTYIYVNDFKETYFYKDLNRLEELQKIYFIHNGRIKHETPLYIILNNNKFDCIDKSIELDPFNSSHFLWMDFGINHVSLNNEKIHEWINQVPDKIKQMCINPYVENVLDKDIFVNIYHHMAGGLFSGSKENMQKYSELFKKKTQKIYDENWYQIDEAVMTIVHKENPEIFDLFYGDYQGIVSNYVYPMHNIDLILTGSEKCIHHNKVKQAYEILCYCSKYFEINTNDRHIIWYISQHIIVDYYHNGRHLLQSVVDLINLLVNSNKEIIINLLKTHVNNINFYENKGDILGVF